MPKLKAILADVGRKLEEQMETPRDERDAALGLLRIVRSAVVMAQGIDQLRDREEEAILVLFRALYEKLLDVNQVALLEETWQQQVLKMRAAAFMELAAFARDSEQVEAAGRAAEKEVEFLRSLDRAAVEEVEHQRRRGKYHWSGKSRSALEEDLPPSIKYYALLSWIAHGSLGPVLEYRPAITADTREVAGVILLVIWNLSATLADFPRLAIEDYGFEAASGEPHESDESAGTL